MNIVFICPYFGKLPNYFPIWLKTCEYNKDITWLIFTDDKTKYKYPENVKVNYFTFSEFREYIKGKLAIEINLEQPYKLCDFKPLYGSIFEEYIKEYDFWGHCDIDCIFGNIRKFITDDILNNYDKILFLGHMTLYRNVKEVNERYKIGIEDVNYKKILKEPINYKFDEAFDSLSMNTIYKFNNFPMYIEEIYFDICPLYYDFRKSTYIQGRPIIQKTEECVFEWIEGKLVSKKIKNGKIESKEYAYVHFQKRKIKDEIIDIDNCKKFILIPNKFIPIDHEVKYEKLKGYQKTKKIFYDVYFKQRYKNLKYKLKMLIKEKIKR